MSDESTSQSDSSQPAQIQDALDAIRELGEAIKEKRGKDRWDKFAAMSTFLSSVVIALLGIYFTHTYRTAEAERLRIQQERQNQLNELEAIAKFMPYLTGDNEDAKVTAITSIRALAGVRIATVIAELHPSRASARALEVLAAAPRTTPGERELIQSATEHVYDNLPSREILYVTNRKPQAGSRVGFGRERGDTSFGTAVVSLPKQHEIGQIEQPTIWRMEFNEKPERHVSLRSIESIKEDQFYRLLQERINASDASHILVFVHGFNVSFEDATRRLGQLANDLSFDGVPLLYSWPSNGSPSRYTVDEQNVAWAMRDFAGLLRSLRQTGPDRISVLAHGLGCRLTLKSLNEIAVAGLEGGPLVDQLMLTAADIDRELFKVQIAERLPQVAKRTTLYVSSDDAASLAISKIHGAPVLGDASGGITLVPGLDSILVRTDDLLGHNYYGSDASVLLDIGMVLDGMPADQRPSLQQQTTSEGSYWLLR